MTRDEYEKGLSRLEALAAESPEAYELHAENSPGGFHYDTLVAKVSREQAPAEAAALTALALDTGGSLLVTHLEFAHKVDIRVTLMRRRDERDRCPTCGGEAQSHA